MRVPLVVGDFLERCEVYGERTALVDEPGVPGGLGRVSFAELCARARGMGRWLEEADIAPGERVAVVSPNAARMTIAFFGVCAAGRVLVPLNYRLTPGEVADIVGRSGASALLVDPDLDEALAGVRPRERVGMDGVDDTRVFAPSDAAPASWEPDEDALCTLNYTSGTTAGAKGVMLTHRTVWIHALVFAWQLGVTARDAYLQSLPQFHANGWGLPFALAGIGARQVVLRRLDGEEILGRIRDEGVTFLCGSPPVVAASLAAGEAWRARGEEPPGRGQVRMMVGGAPPSTRLIARVLDELGWEFIHGWGLTESAPVLTLNRLGPETDDLTSEERARLLTRAGPPVLGVRIRVDGDGEVLARSNHVFAGYWEQPDATADALDDGWLRTGDAGHLEPDGALMLTDRRKDVIVSGAENVSSMEVENAIAAHPAVADVAVIGVPDERWGEAVRALVVLRPGEAVGEAELIDFARERLARFKVPKSIELRDALPRTATGKVQKYKLREPYWRGRERGIN
jgi:acyl-CoA synthetase (AMP-forming)/AMP-acid ligase II